MTPRRMEWDGDEEIGYPPRSLKLGMPVTAMKGGEGSGGEVEGGGALILKGCGVVVM